VAYQVKEAPMPDLNTQPDTDGMLSSLVAAAHLQGKEATEAWSRRCDRYVRYMNALVQARENGELLRAHVDFLQGGLDDFSLANRHLLQAPLGYGLAAVSEGLDETTAPKLSPVSKPRPAKPAST
jgi:hypothetical protein